MKEIDLSGKQAQDTESSWTIEGAEFWQDKRGLDENGVGCC